jgi:hypothetical protein
MRPDGLTILFSGMMAGDPHQGGATWAVLQYLLGFKELGHDVYFIEPIRRKELRPPATQLSESENARYFNDVVRDFALEGRAGLLLTGTSETVGLSYHEMQQISGRADVLFNVSGMLEDDRLIANIPTRVYLDLDPAFVQIWAAEYGIDMRFDAHNQFVTIGQQIGERGCDVPTCDLEWRKTNQPVVLSEWPVGGPIARDAFTTIGNWRAYGSTERDGVFYGQKVHSTRDLIDLPTRTTEQFAAAFAIYPGDDKDIADLRRNDWNLLEPRTVAGTPREYRRFVQGSKAELGIAKSGYVKSRCGWFSDRSACYLASGRPVVAQETGFSRHLPTGEGLLAFATADQAAACVESVRRDYDTHSRASRRIAEDVFDSKKVLPRLLEAVL